MLPTYSRFSVVDSRLVGMTNFQNSGQLRFLRGFGCNHALALAYHIEHIRGEVRQYFTPPIGPKDFCLIEARMITKPEVYPQVVLREITCSAQHFAELNQVARDRTDTRIQGEAIAFCSFQLKADPMVLWAAFRP